MKHLAIADECRIRESPKQGSTVPVRERRTGIGDRFEPKPIRAARGMGRGRGSPQEP